MGSHINNPIALHRFSMKPQSESLQTPRKEISQPATVSKPSSPSTSAPVIPDKEKQKIAVMKSQALNDASGGSNLGTMVSEMFTTEVVNSDAFKIVEREQLRNMIVIIKTDVSIQLTSQRASVSINI